MMRAPWWITADPRGIKPPTAGVRPAVGRIRFPPSARTLVAALLWRAGSCGTAESAPGGIRTHDLWLRRPTLYPAELLARHRGGRGGHSGPMDRCSRELPSVGPSCPSVRLRGQSGRVDLNHRPPGPEPGALTGLRYAPKWCAQ